MALSGVYPAATVGARFEETSTTALFSPGETIEDNLGGKWMYVKANGTIAQYDLCIASSALIPLATAATATTLTTTNEQFVGIAQVAFTTGDYGWIWRGGNGGGVGRGIKCNVNASTAADVKVYGTITAGKVDDAVSAPLIQGLTFCALTASGSGEVKASTILTVNAQD